MRYHNFNDQSLAMDRLVDRMVSPHVCRCEIRDRIEACMARAKTPGAREILSTMLGYVHTGCYCYDRY